MSVWMRHQHCSMATLMLGITFITISYDLGQSKMGVQAWTYNYTTGAAMDWASARQYCQDHFTDMVAIQNQEEIRYLNDMLPYVSGYYWIGIRKESEKWTWVGTRKELTEEAANWAIGEPNGRRNGEDCVEIYIKRQVESTKWNDADCNKKKQTICYTASCSEESCSDFGECVETIGDFRCKCLPGFEGPRCENAVACGPLLAPEQGTLKCVPIFGENRFNSSCQVECNAGFKLQGAAQIRCLASAQWAHPTPSCTAVECPAEPNAPSGGSVKCSHPIAPHSFTSTCEFSCDEGFVLQGAHRIQCGPTGQWTHPAPNCTAVACGPLLAPEHGTLKCVPIFGENRFNSSCQVECNAGFKLQGAAQIRCLASAQWAHPTPSCTAVECPAEPNAPSGGSVKCSHPIAPHSFTSTCEFSCDEGFVLQGAHRIQCGPTGQWTHPAPNCTAVACGPLLAPEHGTLKCVPIFGENRFNSSCQVECNAGFKLQGAAQIRCLASAQWAHPTPSCTAVECPAEPNAPSGGSVKCSHPIAPHSFTSTCEFSCDEGFVLQGAHRIQCGPTGQWTHPAPNCTAVECPGVSAAPSGGSVNCTHPMAPHSFTSTCEFSCDEGFVLQGAHRIQCDPTGQWTDSQPTCKAVECLEVSAAPSGGSVNCSHPIALHSFTSTCEFSCDEGFVLQGAHRIQCDHTGQWTHPAANCTEREVPLWAAMLKYTAMGAGSAVGLLGLIGAIVLLIKRMTKKRKAAVPL